MYYKGSSKVYIKSNKREGSPIYYYMISDYTLQGSNTISTRPSNKIDIIENSRINPRIITLRGWLINENLYNKDLLKNPLNEARGVYNTNLFESIPPTYIDADMAVKLSNDLINGDTYEVSLSTGLYEDCILQQYNINDDMKQSMQEIELIFQVNYLLDENALIKTEEEKRLLGGLTDINQAISVGKSKAFNYIEAGINQVVKVDLEEINKRMRVFKNGLYIDYDDGTTKTILGEGLYRQTITGENIL